ncbi:DUF1273 domain-containing protein [Bacillus nitratireducens]|uniref:DUF1273 domain-containing protein n=1 Tax=Bacillus nitratireducens TaxID=2026193 RepID=UPI001BACBAE3|nr:DUF1273 domain-containing protein [Bacillus nitratireducens]QUG83384.1 DUF1273 family protein [Bacillus nitratireducens]
MKVVTVTGYKPFELGIFKNDHPGVEYIKKALRRKLTAFVEDGLEWVIISGQLGVELWAAEVVFEIQVEYPDLKLAVFTPFLEQEENWKEDNREYYEFILSQADHIDSITKRKYESPEQFKLKNQFFIAKSDALLAVYDEEKPGSPKYIVEAAKKKGEIENYHSYFILFSDLQDIMEEEQWNNAD